ncbi:MAG: HD domain-containing protein [Candidatus Zixiibacteriota bacterium]|jgi:anti-anti-sigma factor
MAKELSIRLAEKTPDGVHIFRVSGALGVEGSAGIQGLLDACMKEGVNKIVLDLHEVGFISSAGMGAFLSAVGELRKKTGDIIFARMQDKILSVFKNLDVLDYFIVADDVEQAVERFRGGQLPQPPSIEELTAGSGHAGREEVGASAALFSLLAAYADILGTDADASVQLSQIVDVTANYLAIEQCAFVPLTEALGLATAAARGAPPAPTAEVKSVLAGSLAGKEIVAVDQLPTINKELAAWAAESRAHFIMPLAVGGKPVALLAVGDKKDGKSISTEEKRILRYLRTSLNLALEGRMLARQLAGESPGDKKVISRRTMEMETLFSVSQSLAGAMETEKMLPTFLMMITGQYGTDRAAVLLPGAGGEFVVRSSRGVDESALSEMVLPKKGLAEIVGAQIGPAVLAVISLTLDEEYRPQIKPFVNQGLAVLAPMRYKNRLIGIVALGAKISGRDFDPDELRLLDALVNLAAVSIETALLLEKTKKNYGGLVRALISAIEAKDKFTRGHTERVTLYAAALADEIGLPEEERQNLLFGAVLHDVGYLGVPEEILRMPDGITEQQLEELRQHPLIGCNILKDIPLLSKALDAVRSHHESYDGSGYPDGLAGEDIPIIARIVAVADTFDAITTDRRYRKAKSKEEALEEIKKNRGTQFDPAIADRFVELVESGRLDTIKKGRKKQEG